MYSSLYLLISLLIYSLPTLLEINLSSIKKKDNRDITLLTKVHIVKAMVFPVFMYGCESWSIKRLSTEEMMLLNCGAGEDS